jgi:dihydrofolate reductase
LIISIIVAVDEKNGIGKSGGLPWRLPSDLKRFKKITMGHHLLMGRKTYETIGRPLPGRVMIIVTRKKDYHPEGCIIANSTDVGIDYANRNNESELFIIGGGEIFTETIQLAGKIY